MKSYINQLRWLPHRPIVAVITVCLVVFLVEEVFNLEFASEYGARPAEFQAGWRALKGGAINVDVFKAAAKLFPPLVLHGGPEHILGNMVFLWAFGSLVSRLLGNWWALWLFLLSGAFGNVTQIAMNPDSVATIIGASGGVAGLEGVYFGLCLRWSLPWPDVFPLAHPVPPGQLALFAAVGIAFDLYAVYSATGVGVAYGAHIGGFASGLLFALLVSSRYGSPESWQRKKK